MSHFYLFFFTKAQRYSWQIHKSTNLFYKQTDIKNQIVKLIYNFCGIMTSFVHSDLHVQCLKESGIIKFDRIPKNSLNRQIITVE